MKMFEDIITDVDLTIYDYYQKSRAEQVHDLLADERAMKEKDRKKYYEMVRQRKKEADERYKKNGHRRY